MAEALKAKVDISRQGWLQATNELKRQLEEVLNEVTGLSSHRAQLDKSGEELKGLQGKALNCDRVTNNMAEEIWRIGLNFEDPKKRVHGVEAMVESHKASVYQLINRVHNLEHPAVSSTSTGGVGEAKVPATEVRRISADLEITSAQVATLTGQMHHWGTVPKPEWAKTEALELQVLLLMTRLEQSEHEAHALREEIRTRPHGGPPKAMRPDSHVMGELQRTLESLEKEYLFLKHAGTPLVNPIGIPTAKPEPRVPGFGVPAGEERVGKAYQGLDCPRPRMTCRPCGRMTGVSGEEPQGERGVGPASTRNTPRLAWGVIGGSAPSWTCATLRRTVMVGLCHGWCFSCLIDKNLSRIECGLRNKSNQEFYGQWRLMKLALNDVWTPRSTGKSHILEERIRG